MSNPGRTRVSARLRDKQAAASGFRGRHAEEGSPKVAERQCPVKRPRGKCSASETDRRPENGLSRCPFAVSSDGERGCVESLDGVAGCHSQKSRWICPAHTEKGDRMDLGLCPVAGGHLDTVVDDQDDSAFLDDDSNQIMPVGQFFGNLELVQDYPPRAPLESHISRREYRRLHYIARDDSDEDAHDDPLVTDQDNGTGAQQCRKNRKNGLF